MTNSSFRSIRSICDEQRKLKGSRLGDLASTRQVLTRNQDMI
jgi:hypothetical protein